MLLLYNNYRPYISLCIIVNIVGLKNVHFWDQRIGCSILLNWWCREEDIFVAYFLLFLKMLKVMNRGYQSPSIMVVWKTARLLQFLIGNKWTENYNACTCSRHGVWRYLINHFVFKLTFKVLTTLTSRCLPEYYQCSICRIPLTICNKDYNHVCSKQKGANKWYFIASLLKVSCSHRQDLTKISSFIP